MIDKWLKAGVLEDGLLRHATEGSPHGGVISPCLSNIFLHPQLHRVLDRYARLCCPVQKTFQQSYHWSLMQVEYATDLVLRAASTLAPLYDAA